MNLQLDQIGRYLLITGVVLVILGGILVILSKTNLKELPGTLRIEWAGGGCVFPLLASIVLSIVLTVLLNVAARFFQR